MFMETAGAAAGAENLAMRVHINREVSERLVDQSDTRIQHYTVDI